MLPHLPLIVKALQTCRSDLRKLGVTTYFHIVSKLSPKCLTLAHDEITDGTLIQLYSLHGGDSQQWELVVAGKSHPTEQQKIHEVAEALPTPTPTPQCEISEPIFDEAYRAKWQVTNNDSDPTEISAIYFNWDASKTGKLYRIWFTPRSIQTKKIIWSDLNGENPPLTISSGWDLEGIRSIDGGGTQKTLGFEFGKWKSGSNNPDLYSLHVTFDNGCEVSSNYP
jgi:hypothetical protein